MSAGFPTLEQVETADVEQCLRWNRFLGRPQDEGDLAVVNANHERLIMLHAAAPSDYVAASKSIGWDR